MTEQDCFNASCKCRNILRVFYNREPFAVLVGSDSL